MTLLPAGMAGVVAAAMLAATMSALDSSWNVNSAVLTKDVYQRLIRPGASGRELLTVGRLTTALVGVTATAIAVTIALTETRLFGMAQTIVSTIQAPTILPFLMGIMLPFLPRWSALAGILVGLAAWCLNATLLAGAPFAAHFAVSFGSVAGALLLFAFLFPLKDADQRQVEGFFERLRQPAPPQALPETGMPNPLRVVGVFVGVVGLLVLVLSALPQSVFDRILTASSGLVLASLGLAMYLWNGKSGDNSLEDN